jgi:hypothetical protein
MCKGGSHDMCSFLQPLSCVPLHLPKGVLPQRPQFRLKSKISG